MIILTHEISNYHAVLEDSSALRNGIAGGLNHRIGIIPNGACEVVPPANFDGPIHRRF